MSFPSFPLKKALLLLIFTGSFVYLFGGQLKIPDAQLKSDHLRRGVNPKSSSPNPKHLDVSFGIENLLDYSTAQAPVAAAPKTGLDSEKTTTTVVGTATVLTQKTTPPTPTESTPTRNTRILKLDIEKLDQNDPALIKYVRRHHITPPSTLPYNFPEGTETEELSGIGILPLAFKKKKGFFLEAGAFDGRTASFSLALEFKFGWSGLLVECNPNLVPKVRDLNRKAFFADVCISKSPHPATEVMTSVNNWMASSSLGNDSKLFPDFAEGFTKYEVQTIPLYTLLAAANVTEVDLAILDVQSFELDVLRNFPFELILVKVWMIEHDLLSEDKKKELMNLMLTNGYLNKSYDFQSDYLFIHQSATLS